MMQAARIGERLPVALAMTLIAVSCAEYALSIAMQHSFPRDLNLAYMPLGLMYRQMAEQTLRPLLQGISQPGGWFNGAVALWMHVAGRSAVAFNVWGLAWYALLLTSVFGLGRRWFGGWAGLASIALVAQMPVLVLSARGAWIHIPEAALMIVGAWALAADPRVQRWRTVGALSLCGALAMALRASGVVWTALLFAVVVWGVLWDRVHARSETGAARGGLWGSAARVGVLSLVWGLALRVPFPLLARYLGSKMDVRDRYAGGVRFIGAQLWTDLQPAACALLLLGFVLALRRRRGDDPLAGSPGRLARWFLLGAWAVGGVVAWAIFRAGIDNFPLFFVAIALYAGSGLASLGRPWPMVLVGLGWIGAVAVGAVHDLRPPPSRDGTVETSSETPIQRLEALLNATCPNRAKTPCLIVADQGLTYPASEDPGMLQLFLMKEDGVRLEGVHQPRKSGRMKPAAVATWTCPDGDAVWHDRFPMNDEDLRGLVQRLSLLPAWTVEAEGCSFWWLTENGAFVEPDAAPASGRRSPSERPAWWAR